MKLLLWHGYLLGGTGSNEYSRALAREWSNAGHEVVVFCQEAHPSALTLPREGSFGETRSGAPLFFLDRYESSSRLVQTDPCRARSLCDCQRERPPQPLPADLVFANHVALGARWRCAGGPLRREGTFSISSTRFGATLSWQRVGERRCRRGGGVRWL